MSSLGSVACADSRKIRQIKVNFSLSHSLCLIEKAPDSVGQRTKGFSHLNGPAFEAVRKRDGGLKILVTRMIEMLIIIGIWSELAHV